MANLVYKSYAQNEIALFPLTLDEMIPSNHRARVVNAVIDRLDISAIESRYKGGGTSIYNPRMLLKVITYAYLDNVYSGRRMEALLSENVAYMWLSGMNRPDFRTINMFRCTWLKGGARASSRRWWRCSTRRAWSALTCSTSTGRR